MSTAEYRLVYIWGEDYRKKIVKRLAMVNVDRVGGWSQNIREELGKLTCSK